MNIVAKSVLLPLLAISIATPALANIDSSVQRGMGNRHHGRMAGGMGGEKMNRLNLTPEQKAKVEEIKKNTRSQIQAILTPEQKQKFKAEIAADVDPSTAMRGMYSGLTTEQKDQIKSIRKASREQFKAVLTPEQVKQIEEYRAGKKNR
jgi:periplasmic protein CpxP/Spy